MIRPQHEPEVAPLLAAKAGANMQALVTILRSMSIAQALRTVGFLAGSMIASGATQQATDRAFAEFKFGYDNGSNYTRDERKPPGREDA